MIEPRRQKNGITISVFVMPPNATLSGNYPTHILGCKLTAFGLKVQRGTA